MAASYPSSVKSFATRTAGQTIAGSWFNDPQDEIAAVEGGLLNGIAHTLKPSTLGGQDLGTTSLPWANGYFTGLPMDIGLCEGRLTLTSGLAVTIADVTAAGTIYFTPYKGNRIALYDGTNWALYTFTELSLALTATSGKPYDVFVYNNAGVLTLETLVWTNDSTRATALALQNGVYVKTGATTRRYLGSFYATGANVTENSFAKRNFWNYYNQVEYQMLVQETNATHVYNLAAIRQAGGNAANQLEFMIGVGEVAVEAAVQSCAGNGAAGVVVTVGIGLDSTTAFHGEPGGLQTQSANNPMQITARYRGQPAAGRHTLSWNEYVAVAGGNTTFYNTTGSAVTNAKAGIGGRLRA